MSGIAPELLEFSNGWLRLPSGNFINMDWVVHVEQDVDDRGAVLYLHRAHGDADSFVIIRALADIAAIIDWLERQVSA